MGYARFFLAKLVGLMSGEFFFSSECERELLAACREFMGGDAYSLRQLNTVNQLPDATLKFFALDSRGRPTAFVHWSNEPFPNAALASCSSSAVARDTLGERLGKFVAMPIFQGEVLSRSFSVHPILHSPSSKVGSKLAYLLASKAVGSWLRDVATRTVKPVSGQEVEALVLRPLEYIAGLQILPDQYKVLAGEGLAFLSDSSWSPQVVFSHNDFWIGNVMFSPAKRWPGMPQIIDWGSSSAAGIPFFDSIRYVRSARLPSGILAAMLKQQLIATKCSPSCGLFNLLAGLGRLGLNRDQFPEERFAQLAVDTVEAYNGVILNFSGGDLL